MAKNATRVKIFFQFLTAVEELNYYALLMSIIWMKMSLAGKFRQN
jgi:hypothetical protein